MTTSILLRDIGSFSVQLAIVIAVGAVLARLWRIHDPRVMLTYWRSLLLACLILPVCQEWRTVVATPPQPISVNVVESTTAVSGAPVIVAEPSVSWRAEELALLVVVAGIAARALWLALGAFNLRRLRRSATPLVPVPQPVEAAQARVGARATVYVSDRVTGPVSFGLFRPVIIVPPKVVGMGARLQEAIAYHELLHVRRRDWVDEITEEIVRTVFWFHPAVRWLLARVRLSREQVVDQAVIRLTESRESYIEALLAVALAKSPQTLVPAPLFFRRGLLKQRVAHILQESTMTTRRMIASLAVSAAALLFVADTAVRSFPLQSPTEVQDARTAQEAGPPVQIIRGGENLLHGALPEYPRRAVEQRIEGDVLLDLTIDERGEVSDARVLSGPDELRRAALESVLQWHYSPAALRSTSMQATLRFRVPDVSEEKMKLDLLLEAEDKELRTVTLSFKGPDKPDERQLAELEKAFEMVKTAEAQRAGLRAKHLDAELALAKAHQLAELREKERYDVVMDKVIVANDDEEPRPDVPYTLFQVRGERVSQEVMNEVLMRAGAKIGDVITREVEKRIERSARSVDEHLAVSFMGDDDNRRLTIVFHLP
jgi:TonB family protein